MIRRPRWSQRCRRRTCDSRRRPAGTYRALVSSPEAWQQPLAKFKTPTDYIYSTCRALELPLGSRMADLRVFELLGQRSFQPGSPAGWPDRSADWDGSAALLKRLEWAQELGPAPGQRSAMPRSWRMQRWVARCPSQRAPASRARRTDRRR